MAGKLSHVGAGLALDGSTGRATVTARTTYLALLTAAPTQASTLATMAEYAATGYARVACTFGAPSGTPRVISNSGAVNFAAFTGANGSTVITHWALVSAAAGTTGDFLAYGDLTTPRTPQAGDTASFAAGALDIQLD